MSNCGKYSEKARTKYFIKQKIKETFIQQVFIIQPQTSCYVFYENHPKKNQVGEKFPNQLMLYSIKCYERN